MKRKRMSNGILTAVFIPICILYMMPVIIVLYNSFRPNALINTDTFAPYRPDLHRDAQLCRKASLLATIPS